MKIRPMSRAEVDLAIDWAAAEGWNPGLQDADCFFASDRRGFFIGLEGGQPVAMISTVAYDESFGFLGFYIVSEAHRGQGFGLKIWQAGLDYLGERVVGLDGVPAQQENYKKSGFDLAYRGVRYEAKALAGEDFGSLEGVSDLSAVKVEEVLKFDRGFFPAARPAFLRCWLNPRRRQIKLLVADGEIQGYGVLRECRSGFKIGPLFAESDEGADLLFRSLAKEAEDQPLYLDIPEPNESAKALVNRYAMTAMFETARMYKGPAPSLPLDKIYGITSFELG